MKLWHRRLLLRFNLLSMLGAERIKHGHVRERSRAGRPMAHPVPMLGAHVALGGTGKMNRERFLELRTLSNSSLWCSNGTKDLYFNLKMDFGGVLTFH